ncbi:MAG: hypothetical protein ACI4W0_05025 [Bacilli bacterium]
MNNFIKRKINKIIGLDMQIYDYYQNLITQEENKEKHPDYEKRKQNVSSLILELLQEEQEEYSFFIANPTIALSTYTELARQFINKNTPLEVLCTPSKDALISRRILTTLEIIIISDRTLFNYLINQKLIARIKFQSDEKSSIEAYLFKEIPLIDESFAKTLYTLLDDEGNTKAKYHLSFITPYIETILVPSSFEPIPKKQNTDISFNTMVTRVQKEIFLDTHIGEKIDEALDSMAYDDNSILYTYFKAALTYQSKEAIKDIKSLINSLDENESLKEKLFKIIQDNSKTKKELSKDDDLEDQRMSAYGLSSTDVKILNELLELESQILNAYRGLASLEIKNLKNSFFSKNLIELLALYTEEEKTLLNHFRMYPEIIPNILEYLIETINDEIKSPVELLLLYEDNETVVTAYRTIQQIKSILFESDEAYEHNLHADVKEIVPSYHEKISSVRDYEKLLSNEISKRTISFIEDDDSKESIEQKYYMVYATPDLANEFFQNKGSFPKNLTKSLTIKNDLSEAEKEELQITLGIDSANLALDALLDYYDSDIEEYPHEISLLLGMLRSSLLLTDTLEQKLLLEDLEDTFDNDEEYLKEHEEDEKIRELIKKTLNQTKEDFNEMNKDNQKNLQ